MYNGSYPRGHSQLIKATQMNMQNSRTYLIYSRLFPFTKRNHVHLNGFNSLTFKEMRSMSVEVRDNLSL